MGGWKIATLLAFALVAGQVTDWEVADQLAIALVVLLAGAWSWSRLSLGGVGLERQTASDRAQVGETLRERFEVRNRGRLAKLWLEVIDHSTLPHHAAGRVLHLRGRGRAAWEVETRCRRRGRFRVGPVTLRAGDPLGLFPRRRAIPDSHEIVVYPAVIDLRGASLPTGLLTGGAAVERRSAMATPNVAGVRDYTPSDGFNRISWSATARLGRLMVKEFDVDPSSDAWIVLDLERAVHRAAVGHPPEVDFAGVAPPVEHWLDSTEEYAVTLAASLARLLLAQGRAVGLIAHGAGAGVLPADRGERQMVKVLETLAVVAADGQRPLAVVLAAESRRFTRHDTLLLVTPSTAETWVGAVAELSGRRVRATAVLVEAETFAPAPSALLVVGRLVAAGITTHVVKYGDELAGALSGTSPTGSAAAGRRGG